MKNKQAKTDGRQLIKGNIVTFSVYIYIERNVSDCDILISEKKKIMAKVSTRMSAFCKNGEAT